MPLREAVEILQAQKFGGLPVVEDEKLIGILTETEFAGDQLAWVVVGAGLNVNVDFKKQEQQHKQSGNGDAPLSQTATSLSTILNRNTDDLRLPILQKYLFNVEQRYTALQQGWAPHKEWRDRLLGLGQTVTIIDTDGEKHKGIMVDVETNGALVLQQSNGATAAFSAGDVSLRI
jgi:BirA family biotin operon repressor/biotin-[acetyl-CoA-carboxylase] ligase